MSIFPVIVYLVVACEYSKLVGKLFGKINSNGYETLPTSKYKSDEEDLERSFKQ
jgi:hypothetical protein